MGEGNATDEQIEQLQTTLARYGFPRDYHTAVLDELERKGRSSGEGDGDAAAQAEFLAESEPEIFGEEGQVDLSFDFEENVKIAELLEMGTATKMLLASWKFYTIGTRRSIVKRSKIPPSVSNLERARLLGLVTERSGAAFLAVEEMMKHPSSPRQMKEQIAKNSPHLVRYDDPSRL